MRRVIICIAAVLAVILGFWGVRRLDNTELTKQSRLLVTPEPASPAVESPAEPTPTPEPTATPAPTPEPTVEPFTTPEPAALKAGINPLTGAPAGKDYSLRRPYAVMINNIAVAQPQVGVAGADMIWELMDEGGITRMEALYMDPADIPSIGSIRSARIYNVSVARAYDAILVHAGGSDEALSAIDAFGVSDICSVRGRYAAGTFYRDKSRQTYGVEHSLFAVGKGIVRSAESLGCSATHPDGYATLYGMTFSETAQTQCTLPAETVAVTYAGGKTTDFIYDSDVGLYAVAQFGDVYADGGETPVLFRNVLILKAWTALQEDGLHLSIRLVGSGDGYFCCGGAYTPIRWYRADEDEPFFFTTETGEPLALGTGRTFVAVQQIGGYTGTTAFYGG